jgi:hypothetical protein
MHAITYSKIWRYTLADLKIKTKNNIPLFERKKKIRELKNEIWHNTRNKNLYNRLRSSTQNDTKLKTGTLNRKIS